MKKTKEKIRTYINYCGKSNSGKSTILGLVIKKLLEVGKEITPHNHNTRGKDHRIVIKIDQQCVAISTYGDDLKNLMKNHRLFDQYNPQVMVTASHAHEKHTHNLFIDNYVYNEITADNESNNDRRPFNYIKIQSDSCPNSEEYDRIKANYIYNLIMESLNI